MKALWLAAGVAVGWFGRSALGMYYLEKAGAAEVLTRAPEMLAAEFEKVKAAVPAMKDVEDKLKQQGLFAARPGVALPEGAKPMNVNFDPALGPAMAEASKAAKAAGVQFFSL